MVSSFLAGMFLASQANATDVDALPVSARGGEWITLQVTGGPAGGRALIYASLDGGTSTASLCPEDLRGTCLDLPDSAVQLGTAVLDAAGTAQLRALIPVSWGQNQTASVQVAGMLDVADLGIVRSVVVKTRTDPYGTFTLGAADARLVGQNSGDLAGCADRRDRAE